MRSFAEIGWSTFHFYSIFVLKFWIFRFCKEEDHDSDNVFAVVNGLKQSKKNHPPFKKKDFQNWLAKRSKSDSNTSEPQNSGQGCVSFNWLKGFENKLFQAKVYWTTPHIKSTFECSLCMIRSNSTIRNISRFFSRQLFTYNIKRWKFR